MEPFAASPISWPTGHEAVRRRLLHQLDSGKIPHAQLFAGPSGIGKRSYARAFARRLLDPTGIGGVSDLIEMEPEGKTDRYTIGALDHVREQAALTPMRGSWKVYILDDVERMGEAAAASLLKMLEEPPSGTVFLLISGAPHRVLPTIVSRCHVMLFDALSSDEITSILVQRGWKPEQASDWGRRSRGSVSAALRRANQINHPQAKALLEILQQLHQMPVSQMTQAFLPLDQERQRNELEPHDQRLFLLDMIMTISEWARDHQCLRMGQTQDLCYPQHQAVLQQQIGLGVASWNDVEKSVQMSIQALDRLVKPSVILTGLLLRLRAP
ncbi:MAG: ATP-binding protein [Chlamydiia bacterium]